MVIAAAMITMPVAYNKNSGTYMGFILSWTNLLPVVPPKFDQEYGPHNLSHESASPVNPYQCNIAILTHDVLR